MYRFSIEKENWILRFTPNIVLEEDSKEALVKSILQLGSVLPSFSHGESFVILVKKIGLIVFIVEKIPSLILTVSNIIEKENWYIQTDSKIKKYFM
ncbi:hypothetical protein CHH55_15315 [Niallia circulans]|jgi:hypothetical protein|uniref:Uncharacterized protein n=1 Tax=Niallia circulans TaxID=1397 RepID=A0A0J1IPJ4_NIACI|nr:hypothetical protein [Niallia circulans]KLV27869.1 hypothetical protein ABW02_02925 [Niallia circulans]MCM2981063.1 hypothetical protein [Niallia circulans]MDR4314668.1 hypothetical protein [Niallia circulans]MED3840703.1 hypothetical protein [Niallia circulans]MED4242832.1 hypothetical protein [Niallia circulans]